MAHFPKPAEGSWTEHYPELGTGPVSYEDSISPEHYELEREAIFKKCWLNVGRTDQLPKSGSYFTKEIHAGKTSVIVARGTDGEVRAFHNICRHRGNKLVWQDFPGEEVRGTSRQFTCKYHGWRYGLDGACTFVQQEEEFFDLDKANFGLIPVQVDVWEGFIFVNLDPNNTVSLEDYLGRYGRELKGYPFDMMTEVYKFRAVVNANWKLYIDAFAEFYHAPVLHAKQAVAGESKKLSQFGYEGVHYDIEGPHSMQSAWSGMSPPKDLNMVKPIERKLRSGLNGPWDRPEGVPLEPLPSGLNPAQFRAWGLDSFVFFPNFMLLVEATGFLITYNYWPTSYRSHVFEGALYFPAAKTASRRVGHELTAVTFKEYALQDCNTLEATQTMLESRVVTEFPLNDQEILLRHLHKTARDHVDAYKKGSL
jgi:phenylpropionate dioxygenase-like ring-hydroxylating dioxygenase large terminal subunit